MDFFKRAEWRLYKELKRLRLKNRNATIISSNCNGEFIYYDMRLRFMSPTINLSFDMNDYVKLLENFDYYMNMSILPFEDKRFDFPCGMLGDIEIRFNHYKTFDEAVQKWEERKKRIDKNNMYILGVDGDGCTQESLLRFDRLPFEHKVIFTHVPRPDIKSSFYLRGFEKNPRGGVDVALYFKDGFLRRRYLDQFDYVSFLNCR